ncbi:thiamine-phosphate kinase [Vulcanisaeta thermophila]|uniref:thiamine-phosphate kinase n=1 Tax=Vulcanisaeta thermophila TaxID=867917 RepID=UPI0008537DB5|nr:thiamine-phosphate kinase [Vulcanisaeta thermophila]
MSIGGVGEGGLIEVIRSIAGLSEDNDLEYVELNGKLLTMKIDGIAITTSKMPFMNYYDMGWKVMAAIASDFLVKLSKPLFVVTSLTLRREMPMEDFRDLVRGLSEGAHYFGMKYLGGDLNEGNDYIIDAAALGIAMSGKITRSPRVGDVVVTNPNFGYTGLVFKLFYQGSLDNYMNNELVRRGIEILRRPKPNLNLLGELSRLSQCISASMDSSDGLGKVLWTLSRNGHVRIVVDELPTTQELIEGVEQMGLDIDELVFNGGEEFTPVFSIRSECLGDFERLGFKAFARVLEGDGVFYRNSLLRYRGWDYFTGWH